MQLRIMIYCRDECIFHMPRLLLKMLEAASWTCCQIMMDKVQSSLSSPCLEIHDTRSFEPMTDNCKMLMLSMLVVFISIIKCLLKPAQ